MLSLGDFGLAFGMNCDFKGRGLVLSKEVVGTVPHRRRKNATPVLGRVSSTELS